MNIWNFWKHPISAALLLINVGIHEANALPALSITTTTSSTRVGDEISVNVSINDVVDLYGYQFSLLFDPTKLRATTADKGAFLTNGGASYFDAGTINNARGEILYVFESLQGGVFGKTGSGNLASFSFLVTGSGTSSVNLSDVQFLDSTLSDIAIQPGTLTITAVPEPSVIWLLAIGLGMVTVVSRRQRG